LDNYSAAKHYTLQHKYTGIEGYAPSVYGYGNGSMKKAWFPGYPLLDTLNELRESPYTTDIEKEIVTKYARLYCKAIGACRSGIPINEVSLGTFMLTGMKTDLQCIFEGPILRKKGEGVKKGEYLLDKAVNKAREMIAKADEEERMKKLEEANARAGRGSPAEPSKSWKEAHKNVASDSVVATGEDEALGSAKADGFGNGEEIAAATADQASGGTGDVLDERAEVENEEHSSSLISKFMALIFGKGKAKAKAN
jgi:hypothetical protein